MKADPKAKELFEEIGRNYASENMVSTLSAIAEKLGYSITAQDIKEAIEPEEARRKAKTDKVVSDMEALEDDDLEGVAGGADVGKQEGIYYYRCMGGLGSGRIYRCAWNFTDDDCLDEDACAWLVQNYYMLQYKSPDMGLRSAWMAGQFSNDVFARTMLKIYEEVMNEKDK